MTGQRRTFPLNVPNTGQCADLPLDAVTESMCVVDGDGVHGREPVHAPPFFAAWLNRIVAAQELTVDAALTGDREPSIRRCCSTRTPARSASPRSSR